MESFGVCLDDWSVQYSSNAKGREDKAVCSLERTLGFDMWSWLKLIVSGDLIRVIAPLPCHMVV